MYELFNENFRRILANRIPDVICANPRKYKDNDVDGLVKYFDKFITLYIDDLTPMTINNIILSVHGGLSYQRLLRSNNNPYNDKTYKKTLDVKLFHVKIIDVIRTFFPDQFKKIVDELFMKRFCIFNSNYKDKVARTLIKYTDYLNKLGFLPYDKICNDYMVLIDPDSVNVNQVLMTCSSCLMETLWTLKECGHYLCRECFISNIYTESNIGNDIEDCTPCVTCRSIRNMKNMKYDSDDSDDSDNDDDDDSDDE